MPGLIPAADGLCEWLAIFEGSDPSPPSAPCVVPNYSWIPFNKRQAGKQAPPPEPPPSSSSSLSPPHKKKKYKWMQLKFTHLFCTL